MPCSCSRGALASLLLLAWGVFAVLQAQEEPASDAPLDKEQIEASLKITKEAAGKYEFQLDNSEALPKLLADPVLRWSNPAVGEIHGNVFLWTIDTRPVVVASLYQWFSPHTHMSHEFHSLAQTRLRAKYEDNEVWTTREAGVTFLPLPEAPVPASSAPQRLLQMRKFAKGFSATKKERDGALSELRLLPQPIYRYAAEKEGLLDGALFTFVQGTDPEVFLLLEARGENKKSEWFFAATRMNGVGFSLRYNDREVWAADILPWRDISSHRESYTTFMFQKTASPR